MDKQYDKRIRRTWRRPKAKIHIDLLKMILKNIKLENTSPWRNTWFLVQKIHLHSLPTNTRNEKMLSRSTRTRMDDQRKDHINPKGSKQRNPTKQVQTWTCIPMMWKILTEQIREEIHNSLTSHGLFPEEQKGCRKGSRGTAELLYIDQHILNESNTRPKI